MSPVNNPAPSPDEDRDPAYPTLVYLNRIYPGTNPEDPVALMEEKNRKIVEGLLEDMSTPEEVEGEPGLGSDSMQGQSLEQSSKNSNIRPSGLSPKLCKSQIIETPKIPDSPTLASPFPGYESNSKPSPSLPLNSRPSSSKSPPPAQ